MVNKLLIVSFIIVTNKNCNFWWTTTPTNAHTHNHFTALWTLSGTNWSELVPEGTFRHLDFLVQNGDNTGRCSTTATN